MRDPQFSKGEWDSFYIYGKLVLDFGDLDFPDDVEMGDRLYGDELEANVRLINVAPEMYHMLRRYILEGVIDRDKARELIERADTPQYPICRYTDFARELCKYERNIDYEYELDELRDRDSLWFLHQQYQQ